jgi:hypothetical protein
MFRRGLSSLDVARAAWPAEPGALSVFLGTFTRLALLFLCVPLIAQSVRVYSEFAVIDAKGEITAPAQPREILSPAIVRNGFTSFQIVVQVEPGTPYWLYVGQNPEDAVRVTVYRESREKLEPVVLPYEGKSTEVFWMDLWADRNAPVQRIKVEPQLNVGHDWVQYPMEVRVMDAVVPDATTRAPICGSKSVAGPRLRNLVQDSALAARISKPEMDRLKTQCATTPADPESYLKIRDSLFRMR